MPLILFSEKISIEDEIELTKDQVQHFIKSLRYQIGDLVKIGSIKGELFEGKLVKEIVWKVKILKKLISPQKPLPICLNQSIIKKENLELIVRKAVELNISSLQLVIAEYSSLKTISDNYLTRLEKIAFEAQHQCERLIPLEILAPKKLTQIELSPVNFVAMERMENFTWSKLKDEVNFPLSISIGPEGGWSEKEKIFFNDKNFIHLNLGSLILKSETATMVGLSILTSLFES